jgi:hypothetical protein
MGDARPLIPLFALTTLVLLVALPAAQAATQGGPLAVSSPINVKDNYWWVSHVTNLTLDYAASVVSVALEDALILDDWATCYATGGSCLLVPSLETPGATPAIDAPPALQGRAHPLPPAGKA